MLVLNAIKNKLVLRSCLEIDFTIAIVDKCIKRPLLMGEVFTNCE